MREFKFRAWDVFYKKFVYSDVDEQGLEVFWRMVRHGLQAHRKVPVMQFTSLKDNNGKHIYEGDVVRHRFESYDDYTNYEIVFRDCGFSANQISGMHHMRLYAPTSMEVIGNIYENPELLTPPTNS